MAARKVEGNILAHIQSGGSLFEKLKNLEERAGPSSSHNPPAGGANEGTSCC